MGIIDILLKEINIKSDITEQTRQICDKIMEQEKPKLQYEVLAPKGGLIFLALEVPGRNDKEIGFLTLEREDEERYVVIYYTLEKYRINEENLEDTIPPRRRKVWEINEFKPNKILTQYAMKLKFLRGE